MLPFGRRRPRQEVRGQRRVIWTPTTGRGIARAGSTHGTAGRGERAFGALEGGVGHMASPPPWEGRGAPERKVQQERGHGRRRAADAAREATLLLGGLGERTAARHQRRLGRGRRLARERAQARAQAEHMAEPSSQHIIVKIVACRDVGVNSSTLLNLHGQYDVRMSGVREIVFVRTFRPRASRVYTLPRSVDSIDTPLLKPANLSRDRKFVIRSRDITKI